MHGGLCRQETADNDGRYDSVASPLATITDTTHTNYIPSARYDKSY